MRTVVTLVAEPLQLRAPVHEVWLPIIAPAGREPEGLESHGLEGHVAGEDHEIAPGDLLAVLLFDGPQQATRLVETDIVRPAVEGLEALICAIGTAAAIEYAVGPRAVPGHANKEGTIVAVISRPPVLRGGEGLLDVVLLRLLIERGEGLGVVDIRA